MIFTNNSNIPLPLMVWAVNDSYDYVDDPNYFSATTLLKPTRQIILSRRMDPETYSLDVENVLALSMGTSIHDSIEKAWVQNHEKCLKKLGFSDETIKRYKINPDPKDVKENDIPVYIEHRTYRKINEFTIGGKFDIVIDGLLHDNKSTTTMKWLKGSSDKDYILQGSIYRWLNPEIITEDILRINFVFTDWSKLSALKDSEYPQHRACYKDYPLMSLEETEQWILNKLAEIKRYSTEPEEKLLKCSDEELWKTPDKWKYFGNANAQRATKVFDSYMDAFRYQQGEKKGKGFIKIFPGEARRCNYCMASEICSQRKEMTSS